jgi:hypothetical protein
VKDGKSPRRRGTKETGNWRLIQGKAGQSFLWGDLCNQNYKAPENYDQRLRIIHPHLTTLNAARPGPGFPNQSDQQANIKFFRVNKI